MGLTVKERGEHVATFRYIHVKLMETLAQWVPTTPEMEAKLLFGGHVWDVAQHADALGKRAHELRLPLQFSLQPADSYVERLEELAAVTETSRRIAGFYEAMLPAVAARLRSYLERTDDLMDAPTVRILERILQEQARMMRDSEELCRELPALRMADRAWVDRFAQMERAIVDFVLPRRAEPAVKGAA